LALSRQPAWRDSLVAPVHVARQAWPRRRPPGAPPGRAASVAALSRQRLPVAPGALARPNGLRSVNKPRVKIKILLKKVKIKKIKNQLVSNIDNK